ncbi:MAG: tetratricopeptide repeat protein [Myxococcales bacterium]
MILLVALLVSTVGPYAQAQRLLRQDRPQEALVLLQAARAKEPRSAAVATDLGSTLLRLGKRDEAEAAFRSAIALDPRRDSAYVQLVGLYLDDPRRWDEAPALLALLDRGTAASRSPSGRFRLRLARIDLLRSVGRTAEAHALLLEALADDQAKDNQRRLADLADRIAAEEKVRSAEDWPEPQVDSAEIAGLRKAQELFDKGDPRSALPVVERLCSAFPGWRAPRYLRARALEELGRVDEAARELGILVQIAPSQAQAWRKLGELLALHGGLLEAERADEALRQALAREPSWTDLWILRARVALRRGRPQDAIRALARVQRDGSGDAAEVSRLLEAARALPEGAAPPSAVRAPEPTAQARDFLQKSQEALATEGGSEAAKALVQRALLDSPAFPEAAAAWFALTSEIPQRTVDALWNDGAGLLDLAAQVRKARPDLSGALVRPWVDRAVDLGAPEARYQRALDRADSDPGAALADLVAYAAQSPAPAHLEEAKALRARLVPPARLEPGEAQAISRLTEDRPEAALASLGGRCGESARVSLMLGEVHEYAGDVANALACYKAAFAADDSSLVAATRYARLASRAPDAADPAELLRIADRGVAAASWTLARSALAAGRNDEALLRIDRFLDAASPSEPGIADARAARARLLRANDDAARMRSQKRLAILGIAAFALFAGLLAWLRASSVARALLRRPRLYPAVARTVGSLRHDVLKHRASVLSAAAEPSAREEVARALLTPEPASTAVARAYERLREDARAQGIVLRRLWREPVFGPLVRDLAAAERILRHGRGFSDLARIDSRMREVHGPRLASLLRQGPRTRVDASSLSDWIHGVEAEVRRGGAGWTAPSVHLQGMEVEFPVEREALATIFANLLRNAQAAAAPAGRVLVKLGEERDAAGRSMHVLLVGDSAPGDVTLEEIESRESGRGLAIVRDLTREWAGHVVVRSEEPPLRKAVGACFPSNAPASWPPRLATQADPAPPRGASA